jgi:hypothetical protein
MSLMMLQDQKYFFEKKAIMLNLLGDAQEKSNQTVQTPVSKHSIELGMMAARCLFDCVIVY